MHKKSLFCFWIFLFFVSVFVLTSNGHYGGDGLENYLTAESIVLNGDFSIYDKPFGVSEMRYEKMGKAADLAEKIPPYGLGMALILIPFYLVGHIISFFLPSVGHDYITQFMVSLSNPVILALLALALFTLLRKLGYAIRTSFFSVLIYSFCTTNFIYARSGFSEPMIALLVVLAVLSIFTYSVKRNCMSIFLTAFFMGYALFIKKNSVILLPGFGLYFLYLLIQNRDISARDRIWHIVCFAAPIVLSISAIMLQNKLLYGGILSTEFGDISGMLAKVRMDGYPVKGLYYYLISSGKGFVIYNAAIIFGLFSIKDFFRRRKAYCVLVVVLLLSNLGFYSFIFVRGSLFSWGPRYLFPTLPLMALFAAEFMDRSSYFRRKLIIFFFAIFGFTIQLPALIMNFSKYLFFVKEKLHLPEYLVNFMPELSPIKGAWALLASLVSRGMSGVSANFLYNPDYKFVEPISMSLDGYDTVDIWWFNIIRVNPNLNIYVYSAMILLIILGLLAAYKIYRPLKNNEYFE